MQFDGSCSPRRASTPSARRLGTGSGSGESGSFAHTPPASRRSKPSILPPSLDPRLQIDTSDESIADSPRFRRRAAQAKQALLGTRTLLTRESSHSSFDRPPSWPPPRPHPPSHSSEEAYGADLRYPADLDMSAGIQAALRDQILALEERLGEVERQRDNLGQKARVAEDRLAEAEHQRNKLLIKLKDMQEHRSDSDAKLGAVMAELTAGQERFLEVDRQREALLAKVNELTGLMQRVESDTAEVEKTNGELATVNESLRSEMAALCHRLSTGASEQTGLVKEVQRLESQCATYATQVATLETALEESVSAYESSKERAVACERQLHDRQAELDKVVKVASVLEEELKEMRTNASEATAHSTYLHEALRRNDTELERARGEIAEVTSQLAVEQQTRESAVSRLAAAERQLAAVTDMASRLENVNTELLRGSTEAEECARRVDIQNAEAMERLGAVLEHHAKVKGFFLESSHIIAAAATRTQDLETRLAVLEPQRQAAALILEKQANARVVQAAFAKLLGWAWCTASSRLKEQKKSLSVVCENHRKHIAELQRAKDDAVERVSALERWEKEAQRTTACIESMKEQMQKLAHERAVIEEKYETCSKAYETEGKMNRSRAESDGRELNTLRRQVDDLRQQAQDAVRKNSRLEEQCASLQHKLKEATARGDSAEDEVERLRQLASDSARRAVRLEGQVDTLTSDLAALTQRTQAAENEALQSKRALAAAPSSEQVTQLEGDLAQLSQRLREQEQRARAAERAVGDMQLSLATASAELETAEQKLEGERRKMKMAIQEEQRQRAELDGAREESMKKLQRLEVLHSEQTSQLEDLRGRLEQETSRRKEAEECRREAQKAAREAQADKEDLAYLIEEGKATLARKVQLIRDLETARGELTAQLRREEAAKTNALVELQAVRESLEMVEVSKAATLADLVSAKEALQQAEVAKAEAQMSLSTCQSELALGVRKVETETSLRRQAEELKEKVEGDLADIQEAAARDRGRLQGIIERLQREKAATEGELERAEGVRDKLQGELAAAKERAEHTDEALRRLEQSVVAKTAQVKDLEDAMMQAAGVLDRVQGDAAALLCCEESGQRELLEELCTAHLTAMESELVLRTAEVEARQSQTHAAQLVEGVASDLRTAQEERGRVEKELAGAIKAMRAAQGAKEEVEGKLRETVQALREAEAARCAAEATAKEAQGRAEEAWAEVTELQKMLEEAQGMLRECEAAKAEMAGHHTTALEALQVRHREAEELLRECERENQYLDGEAKAAREEADRAQASRAAAEEEVRRAKEEQQVTMDRLAEAQARIAHLEGQAHEGPDRWEEVELLKSEKTALEEAMSREQMKAKAMLLEAKGAQNWWEEQASSYQGELERLREEFASKTEELRVAETAVQLEREQVLRLEGRLRASENSDMAERDRLVKQLQELEAEIERRDTDQTIAEVERSVLDAELENLQGKVHRLENLAREHEGLAKEKEEEMLGELTFLRTEHCKIVEDLKERCHIALCDATAATHHLRVAIEFACSTVEEMAHQDTTSTEPLGGVAVEGQLHEAVSDATIILQRLVALITQPRSNSLYHTIKVRRPLGDLAAIRDAMTEEIEDMGSVMMLDVRAPTPLSHALLDTKLGAAEESVREDAVPPQVRPGPASSPSLGATESGQHVKMLDLRAPTPLSHNVLMDSRIAEVVRPLSSSSRSEGEEQRVADLVGEVERLTRELLAREGVVQHAMREIEEKDLELECLRDANKRQAKLQQGISVEEECEKHLADSKYVSKLQMEVEALRHDNQQLRLGKVKAEETSLQEWGDYGLPVGVEGEEAEHALTLGCSWLRQWSLHPEALQALADALAWLLHHSPDVASKVTLATQEAIQNATLGHGAASPSTEKWAGLAALLTASLHTPKPLPSTVYRPMMVSRDIAEHHRELSPGVPYGWAAPVLCTSDAAIAAKALHGKAGDLLLFVIDGLGAGGVVPQAPSNVFLPPFSSFRVAGVHEAGDVLEVHLTWVGIAEAATYSKRERTDRSDLVAALLEVHKYVKAIVQVADQSPGIVAVVSGEAQLRVEQFIQNLVHDAERADARSPHRDDDFDQFLLSLENSTPLSEPSPPPPPPPPPASFRDTVHTQPSETSKQVPRKHVPSPLHRPSSRDGDTQRGSSRTPPS